MMHELATYHARLATPFAVLGIRTDGEVLAHIDYLPRGAPELAPLNRLAEKVCRQIGRYLDDPQFRFDLPFEFRGTDFQCRVWRAIAAIPAASTRTYSDLARLLRTGPRAVGGACGANRIPVVIPCHRVVGMQGLGGFMRANGGFPLDIKKWLLAHEAG